jgi:hypothetical protein
MKSALTSALLLAGAVALFVSGAIVARGAHSAEAYPAVVSAAQLSIQ